MASYIGCFRWISEMLCLISVVFFLNLLQYSYQQSVISLTNLDWSVSNLNKSINIPAQIPGGIYSDLRRSNVLKQDILFGKNDVAYRWVGFENWTYQATFIIDQDIAYSDSVKLVFHGLDTVSDIYLNDRFIGSSNNMFVRYKFDIKPFLRLTGVPNILQIRFESPIKYGLRKSHQSIRDNHGKVIPPYCPPASQKGECHINFIRKMQSSFGWDWGPAFPSVGIYKEVTIEYGNFGLIRDILVDTKRSIIEVPREVPSRIFIRTDLADQNKNLLNNDTIGQTNPFELFQTQQRNEQNRRLEKDEWLLKISILIEMVRPIYQYDIRVEINLNDALHYNSEIRSVLSDQDGLIKLGFKLEIDSSKLEVQPWWPNNAGSQTLYKLHVKIMPLIVNPEHIIIKEQSAAQARQSKQNEAISLSIKDFRYRSLYVSEKVISFGFRTVELIQDPVSKNNLDTGLTFAFRVNGVELFAKGSNWIPAYILPEYLHNKEYIRYLLQSAKDANMNMLRVWGGGLYESDEFYELADSLGIMIWHDFMFACALYPIDDEFLSTVRIEIEQQVERLQYHPSIVIWSGNNENEMALSGYWWPEILLWNKRLKEMYGILYVETIKPIVVRLDSTRPFVESSPSNGVISSSLQYAISKHPNDNRFGDIHHYDYISDSFDWTVYPSNRFASEYGFQSYPSFSALASATSQTDWKYPLTANILHRQHRMTGEMEIKHQLKLHFKEPVAGTVNKFKLFIYISQLTQAIAIKTQTEFYIRNRFITENGLGKTMGSLYWQLNDVWAAPSWSSIELGGKWKQLHYFAKRFFNPIQAVPYIMQVSPNSASQSRLDYSSASLGGTLHPDLVQPLVAIPIFAVDLIRDDMNFRLNSIFITINLFRWTSFTPVWQKKIQVLESKPQNVTRRIFEQDINKLMRQLGTTIPLSALVFQIIINQQPEVGLERIENYLIPVYPNKITAMRKPTITIDAIDGPFRLINNLMGYQNDWACVYNLKLTSDSIAMFVWLDLNIMSNITQDIPVFQNTTLDGHIQNPESGLIVNLLLKNPTDYQITPEHIRLSELPINNRESRIEDTNFKAVNNPNQSLIERFEKIRVGKRFEPLKGTGSDAFKFQFNDNAFNMFDEKKSVDLFLSKCLSKYQIQSSIEIMSLADTL